MILPPSGTRTSDLLRGFRWFDTRLMERMRKSADDKSAAESIALSPVAMDSFLGLSFLNGDFSLRV